MRRFFIIAIIMVMLFSLVSCNTQNPSKNANIGEEEIGQYSEDEKPQPRGKNGLISKGRGEPLGKRGRQGSEQLEKNDNNVAMSDSSTTSNSDLINTYPIVNTNTTAFYSDTKVIKKVSEGDAFYGQDANYLKNMPSYTDNGDGTVTDNVTGLVWQQTMDEKMTMEEAIKYANSFSLGGYDDWRIPNIKELFSLIDYTGKLSGMKAGVMYIDTVYFDQPIGDTSKGEREIDAQVWSSTKYVSTTMKGSTTYFGVNFVDGRIKGYGSSDPRNNGTKEMYFRLVRGKETYGINNFVDNSDGTITDKATGLMWQASDDGQTRDWQESLAYAESSSLSGYDDWRLPDAKELQSIVDYTKSPNTTNSPAIDDMFSLTEFIDSKGDNNYGFYWTSTTHLDGRNPYASAAYVCFGEGLGKMNGQVMDVHGAGAVRSDKKSGNKNDYPQYFGPQGDIRYVYNYSLLVRGID
jgi:hypothetical protein